MNRKQGSLPPSLGAGRNRSTLSAVLAALTALFLVSAAGGQQIYTSPDHQPEMPDLGGAGDGAVPLTLEEAIVIALERNLGLQVQRLRRAQSYYGIQRNLGIYDVLFSSQFSVSDNEAPAASALQGAQVQTSESQSLDAQASQLFNWGGEVRLEWDNSRLKTNSFFAGVNPSYNAGLDAVYNQPLLKGFGRTATERGLLIASTNSQISLETLRLDVIDMIRQIENAYWDVAEAQAQLAVALESLELAKELHEMNRIQVEVGTLAPLEMTQSEVGVATREEAVLRSETLAADTADVLRQLLNIPCGPLWERPIELTTDPQTPRIDIDLAAAMETAIELRPEVRQQNLALENLAIDSKYFRNLKKPQLDFELRYGFEGLGGDVQQREDIFDPNSPVTVTPGGYDDALQQVFDRDFQGWTAGLFFAYPLQNRTARADSTIADLALTEGEIALQDLLLTVRTQVRRTARAVTNAAKQIELSRVSRELAEKNLDAGQKRYENGISTSFQVLEIQEDLSQARSREVTSIAAYRRALVLFYEAIGRLLEEKGVEIVDDVAQEE